VLRKQDWDMGIHLSSALILR